jgi:lipoyl(octanoyl) transferase
MPNARLILDPPASGSWNMAVDEALLESASASNLLTLRFYQWTPATLSLGYFQSLADRAEHPPSKACPVVRRSTGGGAILHDQEVTYSLIAPVRERFGDAAKGLYDAVHQSLVRTLAELGVQATLYSSEITQSTAPEPFLCFQRRAVGDVIVDGQKIAGSAQRRHHGTVLQHGSFLLRKAVAAPELPGLVELTGLDLPQERLISLWTREIASRLELTLISSKLTDEEAEMAQSVQAAKFASDSWMSKR